ncbi:LOW QUALITY PROTEIN: sphingosine kinase 1-like [Diadema antillarum]|uniref:LOW QUALITY PROTEIN: sphingosine kinase 1-like n=1 Tax=Diadema antillarum TaxID=105358 RepID=UPI003A83B070
MRSFGGNEASEDSKPRGSSSGVKAGKKTASSSKPEFSENAAFLKIFAYQYNKCQEHGGVRCRLELLFVADKVGVEAKDNLALVNRWRLVILALINEVQFQKVEDLKEDDLPTPPHYLVCINPFSGKGKAPQIFEHKVKRMFDEAGITYKKVITERKGHARELAKTMDLEEFSGIIIVSGDGLLFEFINGFREREDREKAFKVPFGMVPGGSGNALCAAVLSSRGEQCHKNIAVHAVMRIIKGKPHLKDLVNVRSQTMNAFSFLSIAWGIIADIDIESERFRFLGETRFTIGSIIRIGFLRKPAGRLSFLEVEDPSRYNHLFQKSPPPASHPGSHGGNQNSNACTEAGHVGVEVPGGNGAREEVELPELSEPVPSNWTVLEGEFVGILIVYISHISNDFVCHPGRPMDEGIILVQYIDSTVGRRDLLSSMEKFKTGDYLRYDVIKTRVVRAFRLEPLNCNGILTVDGERCEYGPIQGAVSSQKCYCIM